MESPVSSPRRSRRRILSAAFFCGVALVGRSEASAQGVFVRGDCTQDLLLNISDPIYLLAYLFLGGAEPLCLDACDVDDSDSLEITDAIQELAYLFLGGPEPPPPFPLEDPDPSGEALSCGNGREPPIDLGVLPARLILHGKGTRQPLEVVAREGEGSWTDVRLSPSTRYSTSDPGVADVAEPGSVLAAGIGSATVSVRYRGVERAVAVRVLHSPADGPRLLISAPHDGAVVASPRVSVSGTVSGPVEVVTVGGVPVPLTESSFRGEAALSLGENSIEVAAAGPGGEERVPLRVVRIDPTVPGTVGPDGLPWPTVIVPEPSEPDQTAPTVAIDEPPGGAVLSSSRVEVSGTVDDPTAEVRVSGILAALEGGTFRAAVTLPAGVSDIVVEAIDPVGNASSARATVTVDAAFPRLLISDPPGPVWVLGSRTFTVRGTGATVGSSIEVAGVPARMTGLTWSADLTLEPGWHDVVVSATLAGPAPRRVLLSRTAVIDLSPPILEIASPPPLHLASPEGLLVAADRVLLAGRAFEPDVPGEAGGVLAVRVAGISVPVSGGTWRADVPLVDGLNSIEISARDARDQETTRTVRVSRIVPTGPQIVAISGVFQQVVSGRAAGQSLVVETRTAAGAAEPRIPVTFRIVQGGGRLDGAVRSVRKTTGADGRASVSVTAPAAAGTAALVVEATAPGRVPSGATFVVETLPGPERVLVAHGPRVVAGVAGLGAPDPLEARLLDAAGNPIPAAPVTFRVIEGDVTVIAGGQRTVSTNAWGVASVRATLPSGRASFAVLEASHASAPAAVRFEVRGSTALPAADTEVEGVVLDRDGRPAAGAVVTIDGTSASAVADARGSFRIAGAPWGELIVRASDPRAPGGPAARVFAPPGRSTELASPLRVLRTPSRDPPDPRARGETVSPTRGALLAIPALPGAKLEVAPGSAIFPDGTREGALAIVAPSLDLLPAPTPDDIDLAVPLAILPESLRFDPPARLLLPAASVAVGDRVPVHCYRAGRGGFLELEGGPVADDGGSVVATLARGGLVLAAVPGPRGGRTGSISGRVDTLVPGYQESPQRRESPVVGWNVLAHSGELFLEEVDLELPVPGRGLPFVFRRRYESRHLFRGALGWNWEHEHEDRRLLPAAAGGNVIRADGRGRFDEYLVDESSGGFVSPIGVFARLWVAADGFLIEREPDGTRYRYHPLDDSPVAGRLESIEDRNGNRIAFARDVRGLIETARDPVGRIVEYVHDSEGRILRVEDPTGRAVRFEYDPAGDLVAVTRPAVVGTPTLNNYEQGKRTEYRYRSGRADGRLDHNLEEIIDPREVASTLLPRVRISYDEDPSSPDVDRVLAQLVGGTNATGVPAGGTYSFAYERLAGASRDLVDADEIEARLLAAAGRTTVTEPGGRIRIVTWSGAGLPLSERVPTADGSRPRDPSRLHPPAGIAPPWYETRWTWSVEGLLLSRTGPRGDRVELTYDEGSPVRYARAHLVRLEHRPAPSAGSTAGSPVRPAVTTWRRDPLFGTAVSETTPRGNDPSFEPPVGGPATPERYTARRWLDYQEGTSPADLAELSGLDEADLAAALARSGIELGLGDLDLDGAVAPPRGNVLKEEPPAITLPDGTVVRGGAVLVWNRFGQLARHTDETGRTVRLEYHPERDPDGDGTPNADPGLDPETGGFPARRIVDVGIGSTSHDLVVSFGWDARGFPAKSVDGNGGERFTVHNELGQLVELRWGPPLRYRRHYIYDADDNLIRVRVENYTSTDSGTSFLVSGNRWLDTDLDRDLLGRVVSVAREVSEGEVGPARSIVTAYRWSAGGALERAIRPVPSTDEVWERDERDLVVRHTVGAGTPAAATTAAYRDEAGNITLTIDAADTDGDGEPETVERRHDGFGRLVAVIDPAGGAAVLARDPDGRVVDEAFLGSPGGPTPRGPATEGNVLLRRRLSLFDERGWLLETRELLLSPGSGPAVLRTRYFRDAAGRVVRRIDPDGGEWSWLHDNSGRVVSETSPQGATRMLTLDGRGNAVRETIETLTGEPVHAAAAGDPDYDETGRFREVRTIVRAWDPLDRLSVLVDPAGGVWRARYDSSGNPVLVSDSEGTITAAAADPELSALVPLLDDRQRSRLNDHGNRRRYVWDNLGRLVEARHELRSEGKGGGAIDVQNPFNPDGIITERYEWDDNGLLVAWTDDAGNRARLTRDEAGFLSRKTWADETVETYERDRDGCLRSFSDASGSAIRHRFDALGRVVERTIERAARVEGTARQTFEYDGLGRVTLARDGNDPDDAGDDSLTVRAYDSLGEIVEEASDGFAVAVERDVASRVVATTYPDGRRAELARDRAGRAESLREGSRTHVVWRHFGSGLLLEERLAPGLVLSFLRPDLDGVPRARAYDAGGEVVEHIYERPSGETPLGYEYGRARSGLPLYERPLHAIGDTALGTGTVWRYDSAYRVFRYLPNVFDPRFPPDDPVEKLVFYPDGNHSWRLVLVNFSIRRLDVDARSAYRASDGAPLEYEPNGCLKASRDVSFFHDALRRLVRVERGGKVVARYGWDAVGCESPERFLGRGRRVRKDVLVPVEGQPSGVLRQIRFGERLVEERDGAGNLLRQYLWGDDAPEVLLARTPSGAPGAWYLLRDALGSVRAVVSAAGVAEARINYGLHGEPRIKNAFLGPQPYPPLGEALAFGRTAHDWEIGMHLVGARHFDPQLGRFLSEASPWIPEAPLELNGYLLPGLPGLAGEIPGAGSATRRAPWLEPFRVRIPAAAGAPPPDIEAAIPVPER